MLKPTVNKDCCWHNVSQYATKRRDRQALPGQAGNSSGSNIAESHTDCDSLVGFGDAYYKRLSQLIDKHLELDTDDVVCYVGDDQGGQVVPVIAERYCIVRPVVRVNPHHRSSDDSSQQMDDVFSYRATGLKSELYFDKIIIYDSIHLFSDLTTTLLHFINALTDRGRLLIIHRPFRLNTLPFPSHVANRLRSADLSLEHLVSTIQSLGLDFHWEIEDSRVVTSRHKWLNMIQHDRWLPPCEKHEEMESTNNPDETRGIAAQADNVHELTTGILRYSGDSDIEFVDRMVFLTINRTSQLPATKNPATVARSQVGMYRHLEMGVTPDIKELLNTKNRRQPKTWSLFD